LVKPVGINFANETLMKSIVEEFKAEREVPQKIPALFSRYL
jgi:hypothetical protein